ncbi:MAG: diguanylate cyclase [Alphaproteobacteria bacterium]|nr:MAG: diguanylate cyclase [Alphaproteobacteria bacterium]
MTADPTQTLLLYFIMPVWFLAGFADYLCHRATDIARTTGPKESLLHLVMFGEIAIPLLMCLFLEINALVFAVMIIAFLAHEATALWDVSYAIDKRYVSPFEQHVHSFLEMIPLMAGSFVAVLHWPQFIALFGFGSEAPRFAIEWKSEPLPLRYIFAVLGAALLLELLPYLEELWRGLRATKAEAARRRMAG